MITRPTRLPQWLRVYVELLSIQRAWRFSAAGFVGRATVSMLSLSLVITIVQRTGSYAFAGVVAGALTLAWGLNSPNLSRLVDRYGQRRVGLPAVAGMVTLLAALLIAVETDSPRPVIVGLAVGAGALWLPVGSLVRSRWAYVLRDQPERVTTAYSFESIMADLFYIGGPVLAVSLAYLIAPVVSVIVAAGCLVVGNLWLLAQRDTEPPLVAPSPHHPPSRWGALGEAGLPVVVLVALGMGVIFSLGEVGTVALTRHNGVPGAAGWILAGWSLSSMIAGLIFGAMRLKSLVQQRFLVLTLGFSLLSCTLLLARQSAVLAVVLVLFGLSTSPLMATIFTLVHDLVSHARRTEGLAWLNSALALGNAAGAALAGASIDRFGPLAAFPVAAGVGAAMAILAVGWRFWQQRTINSGAK